MTVTIHLPSDIEADLVAQARDHGLELPQYVESLLRGQVPPFHRPSGPLPGGSQPVTSPIRRLFRMTRSAAKVSMAMTGDEHPRRYQCSAAAYSA
jgi:hypothetical protein